MRQFFDNLAQHFLKVELAQPFLKVEYIYVQMPKSFTRKLRNMFKRVVDKKGYDEEKRVAKEALHQKVLLHRTMQKKREDELLQEMQMDVLRRQLPTAPSGKPYVLPAAPTHKPVSRTSKRGGSNKRRKTRSNKRRKTR